MSKLEEQKKKQYSPEEIREILALNTINQYLQENITHIMTNKLILADMIREKTSKQFKIQSQAGKLQASDLETLRKRIIEVKKAINKYIEAVKLCEFFRDNWKELYEKEQELEVE